MWSHCFVYQVSSVKLVGGVEEERMEGREKRSEGGRGRGGFLRLHSYAQNYANIMYALMSCNNHMTHAI